MNIDRQVMMLVRNSPGIGTGSLRDKTNASVKTMRSSRNRLKKAEELFVQKDSNGKYRFFEMEYAKANNIPATVPKVDNREHRSKDSRATAMAVSMQNLFRGLAR